jgi:hypothetical protein
LKIPIGNAGMPANQGITLSNVHVSVNKWGPDTAPFPVIAGTEINLSMDYSMANNQSQHRKSQTNNVEVELVATPATLHVGQSTSLKWLSRAANSCSGTGAWGPSVAISGSALVKMATAGTYIYTLACRNADSASSTTLSVLVTL